MKEIINYIVLYVLFALFFGLIFSFLIMGLWNWLMPTIFSLPTITWLQAWGLSILFGLLIPHNNNINTNN